MSVQLVQLAPRAQVPLPLPPYDRWLSLDGEVTTQFYRDGGDYLLRFVERADYRVALRRLHVTCVPVPGVEDELLADLYFNQVVPLVMSSQGETVLHASAAAVNGRGIAFVGATGRGKSTLAASFAKAGHPFLTDDGLIVDQTAAGFSIRPRRPILRLRPDSEAAMADLPGAATCGDDLVKRRVAASAAIPFREQPVALEAIYVLGCSASPSLPVITRLVPAAALTAMMQHSFMLDVDDKERLHAHFCALANIAERVPCYALDYARDYAMLDDVIAALVAHNPIEGE